MHLERELANAQKFAGISPGSVSYNSSILNGGGSNNLSPPELLKQPPVRTIEQSVVVSQNRVWPVITSYSFFQ